MNNTSSLEKGPKACTTCAKAKARCIRGPEGQSKCERCLRLNKSCISQVPAPPRAKKPPKRSRVAELEKRLNELSSQLPDKRPASAEHDSPPKCPNHNDSLAMSHLFPSFEPSTTRKRSFDASPGSIDTLVAYDSIWPRPEEATVLLANYRESYAELFPFIVIPDDLKEAQMRLERPFLWKAIMMCSCHLDGARHVKLGEELLAEIGSAAFVYGSKSLDLLHGLQLLVAWFHCALQSTRLSNLLFLARSTCLNLGLNRDNQLPLGSKAKTLDHMRAYAGTYYLNTLVLTTNKRLDVFMSTTYLDTCCKALEDAMEVPSDEYLLKLVRVQQIAQSISQTIALEPHQRPAQLPLTAIVQSLQGRLDTFREELPPHMRESPSLNSHLAIAEVLLNEIALSETQCNPSVMPPEERLGMLWSCLRALRRFFYLRETYGNEIGNQRFLCVCASDTAYVILTSVKLLTLRLPGWSLEQIAPELAFGKRLDIMVGVMSEYIAKRSTGRFSTEARLVCAVEDPYARLVSMVAKLRQVVATEFEPPATVSPTVWEMDNDGFGFGPGGIDLDDDFWRDLMNDGIFDMDTDMSMVPETRTAWC